MLNDLEGLFAQTCVAKAELTLYGDCEIHIDPTSGDPHETEG